MRPRDITDPKHARKSFSRRHGQVSPDVTHVAVKKLISKGGHATIVSTHPGCGQDNRDIPMLVGNRSERIVERPDALSPATAAVDTAARPKPTVTNGLAVRRRAGCSIKRHVRYAKPMHAAAKAVATRKVGAAPDA
jgi:hypothetical protein